MLLNFYFEYLFEYMIICKCWWYKEEERGKGWEIGERKGKKRRGMGRVRRDLKDRGKGGSEGSNKIGGEKVSSSKVLRIGEWNGIYHQHNQNPMLVLCIWRNKLTKQVW